MSSRNSLQSRDGGRPFSANRTQLPPIQTASKARYPEIKQRGFYSDIVTKDAQNHLNGILNGAQTEQDTLWTIAKEQHTPLAATFKGPENGEQLRESLQEKVHGPTSEILAKSDFPEKSFLPKVQLPFFVPPGHCPRKIEIERRKRDYQSQNLESLLESMDIATNELMPKTNSG
ncbi:putative dynein heavy chain 1, axonemal [Apostichopus japonicus]|uniref:Putative dynein heavy chain 1, axonemal n=1 Tax=Stichopus japonicus TaxID=307972 RepID=A0A2G8K198_STIJA|nr:putative dynein heavy chain 1, axonemal [Apostichopus japonicus]